MPRGSPLKIATSCGPAELGEDPSTDLFEHGQLVSQPFLLSLSQLNQPGSHTNVQPDALACGGAMGWSHSVPPGPPPQASTTISKTAKPKTVETTGSVRLSIWAKDTTRLRPAVVRAPFVD